MPLGDLQPDAENDDDNGAFVTDFMDGETEED
jgi:hypothetical protein